MEWTDRKTLVATQKNAWANSASICSFAAPYFVQAADEFFEACTSTFNELAAINPTVDQDEEDKIRVRCSPSTPIPCQAAACSSMCDSLPRRLA